jgi:hypothetical protein
MSFGPTVFDCDAVAFDIAEFRKPFAEGSYKWPIILARSLVKEANRGSCRLLRARRKRLHSRRAAEQRDELAAPDESHPTPPAKMRPNHSTVRSGAPEDKKGFPSPSA